MRVSSLVILLFSCLVRKQFWLERANLETAPFAQLASTSGFYTWGEVLRSPATGEVVEHNVTLLSIAFREGDMPEGSAKTVRVDDSALQKDASLLARLASFVDASMRVERHPFPEVGRLTISLGVITAQGAVNRRALFTRVDDALYRAKKSGCNCVVLA